ncbi:MAG TPA: MerR family transcriptional regulator [Thermoanaerobaculia bacterium]|nr:MerR family transcriptional regulator [Thermoanaerobaculia bacterium]
MKRALKLAEVCKQLDLPPYVLRYWETEFPALQASGKGSGAGRTFDEEEIAVLRRIKQLLYDEGYTIAGARKKLESDPPPAAQESLLELPARAPAAAPKAGRGRKKKTQGKNAESHDSAPDERIETLRRGVAEALREARDILALLEQTSGS